MAISDSATIATDAPRKIDWPRELLAGLSAACVMLPLGLSAGVLVYAPMGAEYIARGAVAGLTTAIVAGAVAAALSSSSFIVTGALASTSIIPATLTAYLMHEAGFASDPSLIIVAVGLCVLLGSLLQIACGALGLGRIVKYAPHSVIAGFINSIGLLIMLSQLQSYLRFDLHAFGFLQIERPVMFAFVVALALAIIAFANWTKKLPAPLFGLLAGTAAFYCLRHLFPALPLGQTIGKLPLALPSLQPSISFLDAPARNLLLAAADHLLLVSLTIAAVATLQSLLAFRVAQNLADLPPRPSRDLVAQGVANCASALCGGIVAVGATAGLKASFSAGGRTRLAGITCAIVMFLIAAVFSMVLAAIPVAVLSAILIAIGFDGA
jgi:MFS superfamily sulfate permease-like transporter